MKKLPFLVGTFLCISFSLSAQTKKSIKQSSSDLQFGIKTGGNFSKISADDFNFIFNSGFGYYGGIVLNYPLQKKVNLQAELLYNHLGFKIVHRESDSDGVLGMTYITLPISAQYEITPDFYMEFGPALNYNVDAKLKYKDLNEKYDWKRYTKELNVTLGVGAGYYVSDNLAINFRTNIGLGSPFRKYEEDVDVTGYTLINFQLGLNYYF